MGLTTGGFTVGQAALKATSSKVVKYEKLCSDNQHAFILFAFDTFGFLALGCRYFEKSAKSHA
jgi:hypothetical protein